MAPRNEMTKSTNGNGAEVTTHELAASSSPAVTFASAEVTTATKKTPPCANKKWYHKYLPCSVWCRDRWKTTLLGCLSSCIVLAVRLVLDREPLAYLIHSIIVFLDMVLIHFFTNSRWLSITGEIATIIFFLSFHFTKETVYELLETTVIAMLCSFHLIASRNKHKEKEEELTAELRTVKRQFLRRSAHVGSGLSATEMEELLSLDVDDEEEDELENEDNNGGGRLVKFFNSLFSGQKDHTECKRRAKTCGDLFFEYFLDGSAGVMYTSFLGLIIDELISYGEKDKY